MAGRIERVRDRVKALWQAAKSERATPREVAFAIGLGVFVGCTPAIGVHGWVAVGAATLLRLSRLYAFIGSRVSAFFIMPFIIIAEIQTSHFLRTRTWVALTWKNADEEGMALLGDWILGTFLVGIPLATVLGLLAFVVTTWRHRAKAGQALPESSTIPPT